MTDKYDNLRKAIRDVLRKTPNPLYNEIEKAIRDEIDLLGDEGLVSFGDDCNLAGFELERRVKKIFVEMGFNVLKGREGLEDFIISPPDSVSETTPLVLEVKSSRKNNIERSDLRQLDDWVFDLSGEEKARKYGLGGGATGVAMWGWSVPSSKHPTPHKGVLIFNGPVGTYFDKRSEYCINLNEEEFILKRNFCIIPLNVLLDYHAKYQINASVKIQFWEKIHSTAGILKKL